MWKLEINEGIKQILNLIEEFGRKWVILILLTIYIYDKMSFGMLKRLIKPITSKVLSQKLKFLEQNNLILKTVIEQPRKIEYCITETGKEIVVLFLNLKNIINDKEVNS